MIDRPCMSDCRGMDAAVFQTLQAVMNGKNILYYGAPGIGKTMIARRIIGILPPLNAVKRRMLGELYAGYDRPYEYDLPPFRAPHHTVSLAAMVGRTASDPEHPTKFVGELALASFGVLFLDELTEFNLRTLNLTAGTWRNMTAGRPLIVASATPCPCGFHGTDIRKCDCSDNALAAHRRHLARNTEPFDEFVVIEMPNVDLRNASSTPKAPTSRALRRRVLCHVMGLSEEEYTQILWDLHKGVAFPENQDQHPKLISYAVSDSGALLAKPQASFGYQTIDQLVMKGLVTTGKYGDVLSLHFTYEGRCEMLHQMGWFGESEARWRATHNCHTCGCPWAIPLPCVCHVKWACPFHGGGCVGTHD